MVTQRRLVLAGLTLALVVMLLAGSAARPVTVRSLDVQPQAFCRWYCDPALLLWCYNCCDVYGCHDIYCDITGPS